MKFSRLISSLIVIGTLFLGSCVKDKFDFDRVQDKEWKPSLAFPLIDSKLKLQDFLTENDTAGDFQTDAEGLISLVYNSELFSFDGADFIDIPDTSSGETFSLDAVDAINLIAQDSITIDTNVTFTFAATSGVKVDSVRLKGGTLSLGINTDIRHSGRIEIRLPSMVKNGQAFNEIVSFTYTGSPITVNANFSLDGYTLDMTQGGTASNTIPVEYAITLINSGNTISAGEQITISQSYSGVLFSSLFGDFGQQVIDLPQDTIDVKIFDNVVDGFYELNNPKITFEIINSFGFPTEIDFQTIKTVNNGDNTENNLTGFPNPVAINYPTVNEIGNSAVTNISIDRNNTPNISTLINSIPKILVYKAKATSNPAGLPATTNFITDSSKLKINSEFILPLEGYARDISINDTFDIDLEDVEELESALLRISMNNGFPVDASVQIYLLDSLGLITDSLLTAGEQLLVSGQIGNTGKVISPTKKNTDILVEGEKMDHLVAAGQLLLNVVLDTYQSNVPTTVKFYNHYNIDIKVGAKLKGKIKIDFNGDED